MVDDMFEQFKDTKAIIFDMRGYPHETAAPIASRLTRTEHVPAARFLLPDIEVKPSIQGIREGRDDVLERAIEYLSV